MLISFVAVFGFVQFTNVCVQLFGDWGLEIRNADEISQQVEYIRSNFIFAFIMAAILPPVYEELIFRVGGVRLLYWTDIKSIRSIALTVLIISVFTVSVFLWAELALLAVLLSFAVGLIYAAHSGKSKLSVKPQTIPDIYIVIITAVVFMLYHHSWSQTVYQLLLGIIFAVIYLKTKNIGYTMLIHFINNAFVIVYTYYNGEGGDSYPVNFGTVITAVGLAFAAVCVLYNLIKELPNGKEK
jgi:membrane protease YdiL (CAAX protease family)